jgi:hypothetical protein
MSNNLERKVSDPTSDKITLKRSMGQNLPEMICNLAVSSTKNAILELLANSYDADATQVNITYKPQKSTFIIADNGSGMGLEDLRGFYLLGDSTKLREPISPKGRRRIGKFGIGTILLKYLAESYSLVTIKDGLMTRTHESFSGELKHEMVIEHDSRNVDTNKTGTKIVLKDLNFSDGESFSMKDLYRGIQLELPLLPDYKVYLNGEKVAPRSITNAVEFIIDENGEHMGQITGSIYFANRPTKMSGIHIYVNGRRVGDPKGFVDITGLKLSLAERVIGIIDADELESAILFDRGRFMDDHKGYIELRETTIKALNEVSRYISSKSRSNRSDCVLSKRNNIVNNIKKKFINAGIEEFKRISVSESGIGDFKRTATIEFSKDLPAWVPGFYDRESYTLFLNEAHPSLRVNGSTKEAQYESLVLQAAIDAIAIWRAKKGGAKDPEFKRYSEEMSKIWDLVNQEDKKEAYTEQLHPKIAYSLSDLVDHSKMSRGTINYLVSGGLIVQEKNGGVTGRNFAKAQAILNGTIPLYEIVHGQSEDANPTTTLNRYTEIMSTAEKYLAPFVRNIGLDGKKCYIVENVCCPLVKDILASRKVDGRSRQYNPLGAFMSLHLKYFSLSELPSMLDGMDIMGVSKVIDYAKKNHLDIDRRESEQKGVKFKYADIVGVISHMAQNNHSE